MAEQGQITAIDPSIQARMESLLNSEDEAGVEVTKDPGSPADRDPPEPKAEEKPEEPEETAAEEKPEETEEGKPEETAEGTGEETDDEFVTTLTQLAEDMGAKEEELLQLEVEGPDGSVTLQTVIEAYQQQPERTSLFEAEVQNAVTEQRTALGERMQALESATQRILTRFDSAWRSVDWPKLEEENPAEYIRQQKLFAAEHQEAEAAVSTLETEEAKLGEEVEVQKGKYRKDQQALILRMRPDWRDAEKAKAATTDIREYLKSSGYNQEEIDGLDDARAVVAVWEAAQYRKSQVKKKSALGRLRGKPSRKGIREAARQDAAPETAQNKQRQSQLEKFRKSGHIEDGADLFAAHIGEKI